MTISCMITRSMIGLCKPFPDNSTEEERIRKEDPCHRDSRIEIGQLRGRKKPNCRFLCSTLVSCLESTYPENNNFPESQIINIAEQREPQEGNHLCDCVLLGLSTLLDKKVYKKRIRN